MSARPRAAREPELVLNSAGFPQAHSSKREGRMVISHLSPDSYAGAGYSRVDYRETRWTYCAGLQSQGVQLGAYEQTIDVMTQLQAALRAAGSGFEEVVRTWFYLGEITGPEGDSQRYKELNRARSDFYKKIHFHCSPSQPSIPQGIYPASTGIGMGGTQLVAGCLALNTTIRDAFFVALETPQQTPAYAYPPRYSPQSPKFSRAVALVLGNHVTPGLSGTASVVHSVSRHS